ncbi:hypothetical protein GCM10009779_02140 [Polymorphospora rubra]|uniref:Uncharacterized protein n=2 Tax=Polymorphospora rubra TaxID=338584 RepID=A0A810N1V8_9ACTN|nr:hypothetical protein Prubr_27640 [Polymorphospora rubra]
MLAGRDGRAKPLLFDASPLLPSGVFAGLDTGPLFTGADAERAASAQPAGFEANPKRRIDDRVIWLADREITVTDAIAAVLTRVNAEARRVAGGPPDTVALTHPAGWSRTRLGVLATAAEQAGFGECGFVAEPVAAAAYFAGVIGKDLPAGRCLLVYDLGAGTCDVSIVRRTQDALEVVATTGLDDIGGLDLDATIVDHARSLTATATNAWGRLEWPRTPADQRAHRLLWRDARTAKEQLSRHTSADLHIPLIDTVVHVTRDEFETAARPHLERTVDLTATLLRDAGVPRQLLAGIFLVGGSSRLPLVASLLHRTLRIAPTTLDHPELVVAEGALHGPTTTHTPTGPTPPPPAPAYTSTGDADQPTAADITPDDVTVERTLTGHSDQVTLVVFSPDGRTLATAGRDGTARLWDVATGRPAAILTGHTHFVAAVVFSPDGRTLATASYDDTARLWDVTTGRPAAILTGHTDGAYAVAFSPDGRTLATGGGDGTARLWDVTTGRPAAILTGHTDGVEAVAFSPDGRILATADDDGTAFLWDVATGQTTTMLAGHTDFVAAVAFSPDGRTLATAGRDGTARLWDVATGRTAAILTDHNDLVIAVVFSPDGRTLATAGRDGTARLWDVATGRTAAILTGHTNYVAAVAFSPDGRTLATAGRDGTARLWDVATGQTAATLTDHTDGVHAVAFSPDGRTLATASSDGTARLWNVDAGRPRIWRITAS